MTSLSEAGRIVPGKVTIHGLFIESQELEIMSHVTGNDKTLGYSIADFINVFQVGKHNHSIHAFYSIYLIYQGTQ